jgi:AraC family transcriptional regulator
VDVRIVDFPETKVALIEHVGSPFLEHETARKLIAWKIEHRLLDPLKHRSFGIHHTNPRTTPAEQLRVDFCLSVEADVGPNPNGIRDGNIPALRCAVARDIGSRGDNKAIVHLVETWLPQSGEVQGHFPIFFHYVNVGPGIRPEDMITDAYLPLK